MEKNNFVMTTLLDRIERLKARDREEVRNRPNGENNERMNVGGAHIGGVRIENSSGEDHNEED